MEASLNASFKKIEASPRCLEGRWMDELMNCLLL